MSSNTKPYETSGMEYDPTFLNSRKEAFIIFAVWGISLLWTVPYCSLFGYPTDFDPAKMKLVLGIPSWVFWGIAFPWTMCNLFTIWFCLFYMRDDDLGEGEEQPDKAVEQEKEVQE